MSELKPASDEVREPVLDVVDRVSEMLFGLFMALTFVGVVSIADSGREGVRLALAAAFGCNLAWGLADAVMYLIRTVTARGRSLALVRSIRAASPEAGRQLIERSLSRFAAGLVADAEIEAMRGQYLRIGSRIHPAQPLRPVDTAIVGYLAAAERAGSVEEYRRAKVRKAWFHGGLSAHRLISGRVTGRSPDSMYTYCTISVHNCTDDV